MTEPLGFLEFKADLSAPETIAIYDESPLWSAMFVFCCSNTFHSKTCIWLLTLAAARGSRPLSWRSAWDQTPTFMESTHGQLH